MNGGEKESDFYGAKESGGGSGDASACGSGGGTMWVVVWGRIGID